MATDQSAFDAFQIKEYEKIAEAHFKNLEAVALFFRYYLLIMALPLSAFGFLFADAFKGTHTLHPDLLTAVAVFFGVISAAGVCMLVYIANLRMDALLYARAVNTVRRYFYDGADLHESYKQLIRYLPRTDSQPPYDEGAFFSAVVFSFALFDTVYFVLAAMLAGGIISATAIEWQAVPLWLPFAALGFAAWHPYLYRKLAAYREARPLKSRAVGVDIDGVIGRHRHHFCDVLAEGNDGLMVDPDALNRIPVSRVVGLGITSMHELEVFNNPKYWTEMPCASDARKAIVALRRAGFTVHIISSRPWPSKQLKLNWSHLAEDQIGIVSPALPVWQTWALRVKLSLGWAAPIEVMTEVWLLREGIEYDSLQIENAPRPVLRRVWDWVFRNRAPDRFSMSRAMSLAYFVEDEPHKAARLAASCDTVFLIDHPYNDRLWHGKDTARASAKSLTYPQNVVRVADWDEILGHLQHIG